MLAPLVLFAAAAAAYGQGATVRFDPWSPETGPFPSDALTVPDSSQITGLRVNMPLPDCQAQAAACGELAEINKLDGFDIQPRLRITFSNAVDVWTLFEGVFFVALENLTADEYGLHRNGSVIGINQAAYDPRTNTLYAKPDEYFDQHRRYALLVTDAVRDAAGNRIGTDPAFRACVGQTSGYCGELVRAVAPLAGRFAPRNIVAAAVFTTSSVTAFLEKARDAARAAPLAARTGATFQVADLASLTIRRQTGSAPPRFQDSPFSLSQLEGVGRIAFGSFQSPSFLNAQQIMASQPSGSRVATPEATKEIHYHVLLPSAPAPPAGYPVVIAGHGLGGDRWGISGSLAAVLASQGFAVAAMNGVGHGYGPEGRVVIRDRTGTTTELPLGGRAVDVNGDGTFGSSEGCNLPAETVPVGWRDCQRQTALDLAQFSRVIEAGILNLDPARIYFVGQSMGSIYGTVFAAIAPELRAAVLNVGGGTGSDISRCQSIDDAYVLRYRPVKMLSDPKALDVQEFRDRHQWLEMSGDPVGYAMHLKSSTLPGVPIKAVLFQFAYGDQSLPNPASSNLVRAANMRENTSFYRHDRARAVAPQLPANPHGYLTNRSSTAAATIAVAAQRQIALFFSGEGQSVPDVNHLVQPLFGTNLFEVPDVLPEDLNF